jgi:hypothetical protein
LVGDDVKETILTDSQLMNLIKGVSSSSAVSGMQSMSEKNNANFAAMIENIATPSAPKTEVTVTAPVTQKDNFENVNNQLKDSFTQSMAAFQQQQLQADAKPAADDTQASKLVETIQEVFSGQNGFNQMLSNLKGQLETDNGKQIAVLQEQVTKLEEMIAAIGDSEGYLKRLADNA